LKAIKESLKIVEKINPTFKIEKEIEKLKEEIELNKIEEKNEEILGKMKEFVSQLVEENFELVKGTMSEEERKAFEITIGRNLHLQS